MKHHDGGRDDLPHKDRLIFIHDMGSWARIHFHKRHCVS
jgi:hypothetical protein